MLPGSRTAIGLEMSHGWGTRKNTSLSLWSSCEDGGRAGEVRGKFWSAGRLCRSATPTTPTSRRKFGYGSVVREKSCKVGRGDRVEFGSLSFLLERDFAAPSRLTGPQELCGGLFVTSSHQPSARWLYSPVKTRLLRLRGTETPAIMKFSWITCFH